MTPSTRTAMLRSKTSDYGQMDQQKTKTTSSVELEVVLVKVSLLPRVVAGSMGGS